MANINIDVPAGSFYRVPCALVLEDQPVGDRSRLPFETFPQAIEEVYALTTYRKIGADRMPQPGAVAYRGGDWSTFALQLQFRAGDRQGGRADRLPSGYTRARFEQELQEMEQKARWCQALAFPLDREVGDTYKQQLSVNKAILSRLGITDEQFNESLGKLRRNDPPKVLIVFGSWITVRGYVTNVSLKWEPPWDPQTCRPYGCTVNIQFQPLMVLYPTWESIAGGAWNQQATDTSFDDLFPTAVEQRAQEQEAAQSLEERTLGESSPGPVQVS